MIIFPGQVWTDSNKAEWVIRSISIDTICVSGPDTKNDVKYFDVEIFTHTFQYKE